ncbi:MAG: D-alanyl-D-alanine carboxypeptidase/D-alanyl-D-alanine-endopeptidase, partial [Bacteroidetes bacterium]|nr:D-alanyl-D-alanine carboxypeptidase/D-alanyl-D-alanine-endopeptidase [Bacteroidota bacterium]
GCSNSNTTPPLPKTSTVISSVKVDVKAGNPLVTRLGEFSKDTVLRHASYSYCFIDASNDSLIAGFNEDQALVPASIMKLFTTAAALEILEPGSRFKTSLQYEGRIAGHTLHGNLIIKGGGDPTFCLGEEQMKQLFSSWCLSLKKLGVDSVDGSVIGDGRIFDDDYIPYSWTWGEINLGYSAAASGLSVNGNIYELFFEPARGKRFASGMRKVSPYIPEETYFNRVAEAETDDEDVYLIGHPQTNKKIIRGTIPKGTKEISIVGTINNPPLATAGEFLNSLRMKKIYISGKAFSASDSDSIAERLDKSSARDIASIQSPAVSSIVQVTNQASYNFFAESLLKHIGLKVFKYGGTEAGALAVRRHWESRGMDMGGFAMFDGSGISRFNTITTRQATWLLSYMLTSPVSGDFLGSLSVAGVSGTLRTMCINTAAAGKIEAKSGTMSRVKSYAGYAHTRSGKKLIFTIIVNNFDGPSFEMKEKIGKIMEIMVNL